MARPARRGVRKGRHHGGRCRGWRPKPKAYLGDHPQRPLAPGEEPLEVVARHILDGAPSQSERTSVGQHHLQAQDVVRGDAVLHAAQPAGVGGHVPTDGADLETRRVGWVPEALRPRRRLDLHVQRPGLRDGQAGRRVDLHSPHALGRQGDAPVDGDRSSGKTGAGATGDNRHPVRARPAQHGLHLFGVRDPHDRHGPPDLHRVRAVEPVPLHQVAVADHRPGREGELQLLDQRRQRAAHPAAPWTSSAHPTSSPRASSIDTARSSSSGSSLRQASSPNWS